MVALRWAAYRSALKARTAQIAAAKVQATQQLASVSSGSSSGSVRVVNLPPLTITRTS